MVATSLDVVRFQRVEGTSLRRTSSFGASLAIHGIALLMSLPLPSYADGGQLH
jgi:hypothetical protein